MGGSVKRRFAYGHTGQLSLIGNIPTTHAKKVYFNDAIWTVFIHMVIPCCYDPFDKQLHTISICTWGWGINTGKESPLVLITTCHFQTGIKVPNQF